MKKIRLLICLGFLWIGALPTVSAQVVDPLWDRINLTGVEAKIIAVKAKKEKSGFPVWIPIAGGAVVGGIVVLTSDGGGGPEEFPPLIAMNDQLEISCDGSGSLNILNNDSGEGIRVQSFSNAMGLNFIHDGSGQVTISNPGTGTFTISYSITDQHNQTATAIITIVTIDNTPPLVDCPDDITIDCGDSTAPNMTGQPLINDNCDPSPTVNITEEEQMQSCPFVKTITRTFRVTDVSGNTANCVQRIRLRDEQPPLIEQEAQNLTLECGAPENESLVQNWLDNHGGAFASDACGSALVWTHNLDEIPAEPGTVEVAFSVADSCDNTASTAAQLIIEDTTPPELKQPAQELLIPCGADIDGMILAWLDENGGALAEDRCGTVAWTNDFSGSIAGCDPANPTLITFTATDEAGNSITTTAGVSISDTEAPSFTCPPNQSISSDQQPIPALTGLPTDLSDNCSDEIRAFFTDQVIPQSEGSLILRTWNVLDFCGNTSNCVQEIKVQGQNCDFPLSIQITEPTSPTSSNGAILVRLPPEAPPPPYTLLINDETINNIQGRQINVANLPVGTYTITIVIDENCRSETVTVTLSSTGLQERKGISLSLDISELQPYGATPPLIMENELSHSVDDWLEGGTVEHPSPGQALYYDWLTVGRTSMSLKVPLRTHHELRWNARQFTVLGQGIHPSDGVLVQLWGSGYETGLSERFTFTDGKTQPFMEAGIRMGAYRLDQMQVMGQQALNAQILLPFWTTSLSLGLQWQPFEDLEINIKEDWLGGDQHFISLQGLLKIR